MTIKEMHDALAMYCDGHSCNCCPLFNVPEIREQRENCFSLSNSLPVNIMRNYELVFGEVPEVTEVTEENPYWKRISVLAERQRKKGMSKYGYGLEMNPADIPERINHLQEELVDALVYCEWIKEKINEIR